MRSSLPSWRIMGLDRVNGNHFLIAMSPTGDVDLCTEILDRAIEDYTLRDLQQIGSIWIERFEIRTRKWIARQELDLKRLKIIAMNRARKAGK